MSLLTQIKMTLPVLLGWKRPVRNGYGAVPENDADDIEWISAYHEHCADASPKDRLRVDGITWNDLNMDAVFCRINACSCSIGEEYLYHALHQLNHDQRRLTEYEGLLQWLDSHGEERRKLQKILLGIGKRKKNGLSFYLFHAEAKKISHPWIFILMAALPLVALCLLPFFQAAGFALLIASVFANVITYYLKRLAFETEFEAMRYFSALLYGAKKARKRLGGQLKSLGIHLDGPLRPFERLGGFIPGRAQQGFSDLEAVVMFLKAVFLTDLILYNRTVGVMLKHTAELRSLYEAVGMLDAAISAASFRHSLRTYCVPDFVGENVMRFRHAYHPLLAEPVRNSADIDNDSIITGSNASGKSTFIKTLAVNHILAQTIHTCCAAQYSLCCCYVATSMALRDDILTGESYFVAEVKSLKRIMAYCREQVCVCFIDEILRGTNTPERIAASTAVLKALHQTDSLMMVASHDIELTKTLEGAYDNYHFSEAIAEKEIVFDYTLKAGPSASTNAIRLLEYMGFDRQIVEEASALVREWRG